MTNQSVNPNVTQKSIEGIVCVTLGVHLWSGRKRLRKEKLIAMNPEFAKLPPESLATLGAIKICDPEDLHPFTRLKREAEKLLQNNGLPTLGTIGIPEAKLDTVYKGLVKIKAEFDHKLNDFHKRFDDAIDLWREQAENKDWINLLSDIPTPEEVAGKMSFGFHMCRVSAPSGDEFSDANKMYAEQMTGLKGELFADAAREAEILITKYLTGQDAKGIIKRKEKVTWKTLRPLKRIGEKFQSFSFLDPTCEPMSSMISHVLGLLPSDGPIEGVHLVHVWTLSQALCEPSKAMKLANMAFSAGSSAEAFESLLVFDTNARSQMAQPPAVATEVQTSVAPVDIGIPTDVDLQAEPIAPQGVTASTESPDLERRNFNVVW